MFLLVTALGAVLISCSLSSPPWKDRQCDCVSFHSEICANFNYTHACLDPDKDPKYVEERLNGYKLLIESQCHPCLLKFLCFSYYPFCFPGVDKVVRPCRSLCLDVKDACLGLIEAAGFRWPLELNCFLYPSSPNECLSCEHVKECRPCDLKDGKTALRSVCSKEFSLYAHIKVLKRVKYHHSIAFKANLLALYRPRRFRGGAADGEVQEVTIITESTDNCTCVDLNVGTEYFVGGIYFESSSQNSLYILPNNAIIREWTGGKALKRKINRCLANINV